MFGMMIQPWSLALLVAVAASLGALSCFLRAKRRSDDFDSDDSSFLPSTSESPFSSIQPAVVRRGWVILGLSCLLRAGVVLMEAFLAQAQLPASTFKIVSSVLSLSLVGATLLFCSGIYLLSKNVSETWRASRQALKNARQSVDSKNQNSNFECSQQNPNNDTHAQFDDLLADETLHGDEQDRHLAGFLLIIDVLIICASLAAVRWWLLVQPRLDQTFFASTLGTPSAFISLAPLPALGSLFHSFAVTGGLFAAIWLLITFGLCKNVGANATSQSQKLTRVSWETLLLGALLYTFADWRVLHHVTPPNFFDLWFQTLAPLCVGAAAWFVRLSLRDDASVPRFARMSLAVALAPGEFLRRAAGKVLPKSERRKKSFSWRDAARKLKQNVLRVFWRVPTAEGDEPQSNTVVAKTIEKSSSWRAHFLEWRDALTLYVPCLALAAFALRMSLWASSFSGVTSSTRMTSPYLSGGTATALHSWWLVILFVTVGVRHLFFYRREQLTTRRLQNDVAQLSREVATRTRQLLNLHTVGAGLTNTLNRDQIVAAALERMMEAVRGEGGAVWLRADFDRELSRDAERKETPRTAVSAATGHDDNGKTLSADAGTHDAGTHDESALVIEYSQGAYIGGIMGEASDANNAASLDAKQLANDWRMVRSQGFNDEAENLGLQIMNSALQRGGLPLCVRECSLRKAEVGEFYLAPLHLDGEVAGILGVTRQRKSFEPVERRIMEAIASEVAVALRNAQLYQDAHRRAERDSITELLNHRAIQEKIGVELSRARKQNQVLTLVMMDLNNFKFFNDTYGHPTGDGVLKTVARCLRETCRAGDVVGRYGGDEFIAILPQTDASAALKFCRAVEDRIERESFDTHDKDDRHIPISLSFGAAIFPNDGQNTLELLSVADANLYEAKRGGAPITGLSASTENSELRQLKEVGVGRSFGVLDALVTAIDNKDHYTRRHSEDVTHWALLMARELDYPIEQQRAIRISGLLHDVGKIAVPDSILRKPGRLNDDEFGILQQHPVFGALIVKDVPNLPEVLGGIRHHHERFDGKGYPDRLAGENIPVFGRLLAIPDCFSAMTTDRPYRKALTWAEAFTEIEAGSDTQFDPQMVDAFLEVMARIVSQKNQQQRLFADESSVSEETAPVQAFKGHSTSAATPQNASNTSLAATRNALIGETVPSELSAYGPTKDVAQGDERKNARPVTMPFIKQMDAHAQTNSKEQIEEQRLEASEEIDINAEIDARTLLTTSNVSTTDDKSDQDLSEVAITSPKLTTPRLRHTPRNSLTSLKDKSVYIDD